MANKEYLERLQLALEHLHKCKAVHSASAPVEEIFGGQTVWKGVVEVFDIAGHPKAKRAYGWSHKSGKDDTDERFVTVLEIPPVVSPETAVKVAIAAEVKGKK